MSKDVATLYDELGCIRAVADDLGVSYTTAWRRLHAAGVPVHGPGGRQLEVDELARYMASLYREGLSVRQIQERTGKGYSYSFVYQRLKRAGIRMRGKNGRPVKTADAR
ncbi:hypothetical protein AQJ30_15820 [Streptomyces longwoodensis]|uniref:Helix-turn-helix domain-containing protein n=1 Tax=Streptomyces longwoodensis TaxID=68231 RepID=A0A101QX32_9ACTN|nr:helix-turn-helix domain-containing protein [Streptomyces longwoodensis]KUN37750.1 hypothetical protein AQJ30_15820 [Streptomyces longwoodensis]